MVSFRRIELPKLPSRPASSLEGDDTYSMAIKLTQTEEEQIYFCSFTCLNWMRLFEMTDLYLEIYKWFAILIDKGHQICGFVIMPNHLHLLIYITKGQGSINSILSNGKRFLAYEIVKRLGTIGRGDILKILSSRVTPEESNRKKKHRVFEVSSDIKACYTQRFLIQKLEYIHSNPIRGQWHLAPTAEEFLHSSAGYYELNVEHPHVKITHYEDVGPA